MRILVADDDRDVALSLAQILRGEGHEVCTAHDGVEVMQAVQRFTPEVVILDIVMPQLDGYDVARALRARYRGVTLIALTGWHHRIDKILARIAGFDHHFGKPCDPGVIVELLSTLKSTRPPAP